jgi:hypothetical protein
MGFQVKPGFWEKVHLRTRDGISARRGAGVKPQHRQTVRESPTRSRGTLREHGRRRSQPGKARGSREADSGPRAVHASLDFIDSELLVKDVLSKLDRTEFLREQMVAAREARKST